MIAPLRARVLGWLASHEEGDLYEITRDVTARNADVRDELRKLTDEGLVVVDSRGADPRAQRRVYRNATQATDEPGRPSTDLAGALAALTGRPEPTQEDQILSLLADGTVWSSRELHRRVFCVLHSRISALRKKLKPLGYFVEHTGGGAGTDEHFYQLVRVALLSEPSVDANRAVGAVLRHGIADGSLSGVTAMPPGAALHPDEQLALPEAA